MSSALDEATAPPMRPARRTPRRGLIEAAYLLATVLTTSAAATFVLRLWNADWRVPFRYQFDGFIDGLLVKGVLDHGWYLRNPAVGAPFGLRFEDFPLGGDNLQFVAIKVLGRFSGDWALVMNAYFVLSFPVIAAATYLVARQAGVARWPALVVGVLFSFLPYHFAVGELLQSTYWSVPLGAFLVLDALGWDVWGPPFLRRAGAGVPGHQRVRWVVRGVLAVIVASSGSYYALFTMILVPVAAGLRVLADREWRALVRAGAVVALLGAVFALNAMPTLLYRRAHGTNTQVAVRSPGESDTYALHIVDLFLPAENHRIPALAAVKKELSSWWPTSPIFPAPHVPLGLAGAAGLALSLAAALRAAARSEREPGSGSARPLARLGVLNLAAILFGAATGFSALLVLAGLTQIRVWSRISVFIGFFSLVALAVAVQGAWARRQGGGGRGTGRGAAIAAGVAAVVLGLLDQTQPSVVPLYSAYRSAFTNDRQFVAQIERRLPPGSMVFQLPLASFPERPPIVGMLDYQLLRGYLHSTDLQWSYPAMRGRPADWAWSMGGRSVELMLGDIAAAGFRGLYVDRSGFADRAAGLERETTRLAGPPALVSGDGTQLFWDLQPVAGRQLAALGADGVTARASLVLHPVRPTWKQGFFAPAPDPAYAGFGDLLYYPDIPGQPVVTARWAQSPATLELTNPLPAPRPVLLRFRAGTAGPASGALVLSAPGMADVTVAVGPEPKPVQVPLVLPPGTSSVGITSTLPATLSRSGANASFQIQNVTIVDVDASQSRPPAAR
jgi:phosphoglycerol transferase